MRIKAALKVLSLGNENKKPCFYFAFRSLIRTFAAQLD